jgi:hypothetical protein
MYKHTSIIKATLLAAEILIIEILGNEYITHEAYVRGYQLWWWRDLAFFVITKYFDMIYFYKKFPWGPNTNRKQSS